MKIANVPKGHLALPVLQGTPIHQLQEPQELCAFPLPVSSGHAMQEKEARHECRRIGKAVGRTTLPFSSLKFPNWAKLTL